MTNIRGFKRKLFAALIAVFILGAGVGTGVTCGYIWYRVQLVLENGPAGVRAALVDRLIDKLNLNPEQAKIMEQNILEIQRFLAKHRIETRAEHDRVVLPLLKNMAAALKPEQQEKFKKMIDELSKRFDQADQELLGPEAAGPETKPFTA